MRRKLAKRVAIGAAVVGGGLLLARSSQGSRSHHDHVDATYPPLDVPKPIAPDVWIVDSGPINAGGIEMPLRMSVIRLASGDLLLHSPTRFSPELRDALQALGCIAHIVAPNIAHWMYVEEWQRAVPDATAWAAPGLRDRGQVRRSRVRFDHDLGDTAPPAWADEIEQGVIPGGFGFREVFLFHKPSRTLLLTDVAQNFDPAKLPPLTRALMQVAGATNERAAVYLRAVVKLGGRDAAQAAARMVALAPERVVFAHGDWFADNATARLRHSLGWLLPAEAAPGAL